MNIRYEKTLFYRKFLNKEVKGLDFISLCEIDINQGMGYGIKEGLNKAIENDYKFVGWTHADLQIPFESIKDHWSRPARRTSHPPSLGCLFTEEGGGGTY